MPIKLIISILFLLTISFGARSQSELDQKIDFTLKDSGIKSALKQLGDKTNLDFSYSSSFFDSDAKLDFQFLNTSIKEILDSILKTQNLDYKFKNNRIFIVKGQSRKYTISGFIEDQLTGERLIGATIYSPSNEKGTMTNEYGFFSLTLPEGKTKITYSYLGYGLNSIEIDLNKNINHTQQLQSGYELPEIIVQPEEEETPLFHEEHAAYVFDEQKVKRTVGLGGQHDPIRAAQLLPGVNGPVDGLGGLSIRGGDTGQNLLLMDGVPVYIPYHLLGLYSIYNPSTVNSARVLKGGFPARYGGRLSSIFDIRTREGNKYQYTSEAGADFGAAHLSMEGPITKDKGSFLMAGRISTAPLVLNQALDKIYFQGADGELETFFYDFNIKVNHQLSKKDRLYLSFFQGKDEFSKKFGLEEDEFSAEQELEFYWQNSIASIRWNHLFSEKLFLNTTLTGSLFNYELSNLISVDSIDVFENDLTFLNTVSDNRDLGIKLDMNWLPNPDHNIRVGIGYSSKQFIPDVTFFEDGDTELDDIDDPTLEALRGLVNSPIQEAQQLDVYLEDDIKIGRNFHANLGLRGTAFTNEEETFFGLEPRLSIHYHASDRFHINVSGGRMRQYLHLISVAALSLPNDLWTPSSEEIDPQTAWQTECSFHFSTQNRLNFELGGFYKKMQGLQAYPDNSDYLEQINEDGFEQSLTEGIGDSYGIEGLMQYQSNKNDLMLSFAVGQSSREYEDQNLGISYPFEFDQRWQVKLLWYRQLNKNWNFSANWTYSSPNPRFQFDVEDIIPSDPTLLNPEGQKNKTRSIAYHRLDAQLNYKLKKNNWVHNFSVGAYNIYNRKNIAYYQRTLQSTGISSIGIPSMPIIPTLSYSIKFTTLKK